MRIWQCINHPHGCNRNIFMTPDDKRPKNCPYCRSTINLDDEVDIETVREIVKGVADSLSDVLDYEKDETEET